MIQFDPHFVPQPGDLVLTKTWYVDGNYLEVTFLVLEVENAQNPQENITHHIHALTDDKRYTFFLYPAFDRKWELLSRPAEVCYEHNK